MDFSIKTYSEIVINVSDLQYWESLFIGYFKWQLIARSELETELVNFWGITEQKKRKEILVEFHGLKYGRIRFCEIQNSPRQIMRSGAQTWDTGGILDIDLRVSDIDKAYQDLEQLGWQGYAPVAEAVMGPFTVQEVLMKGPDGVVIALVHRTEPPHPNPFDLEGCTSNVYLSAMIVKSLAVANDFFVNKLAFKLHNEITFRSPRAERTMFGLPHQLADKTDIKLLIIGPEENRDGLLDLIELEGIIGEDFSQKCKTSSTGILCYRFPVENLENYYNHVQNKGINPTSIAKNVNLSGIGLVSIFAVISPDGVRLEFFEKNVKK